MYSKKYAKTKKTLAISVLCIALSLLIQIVFISRTQGLKERCTEYTHGVITSAHQVGGGDGDYKYEYELVYVTEDGRYESSGSTSSYISTGHGVKVFYDPDNPSFCYVPSLDKSLEIQSMTAGVLMMSGCIGLLVGLVLFLRRK